jgi:COMPASS component SWD2
MGEELSLHLLKSFQVAKVQKDNSRLVNGMDFDDNNSFLCTSSDDESIRLYSLSSGKLHNTIYSKKYGCSNIRFTHRSNNILYCSTKVENSIRYMSLHDNKYLRYFKGHESLVVSMEMSPADDMFISAGLDNTVRIWDLRSPACTVF